MNEAPIIDQVFDHLKNQTGIVAVWTQRNNETDGEVTLHFTNGEQHFYVEIKKELRQHQLPGLFELAEKYPPFMVVAERIFPNLKEQLRQKKIAYIDAAGNIYMDTPEKLVWIDGNKPIEKTNRITNRAFTKTGLKTVFYLMLHEDAINLPYRKLAEATGVALGNIKNIIEGLNDAGFILAINQRTLKLQNKKALLERWLIGYNETLKPTLHVGTYRFWDQNKLMNWQTLPIDVKQTRWGGEAAAELLTNHLVPTQLEAYTTETIQLRKNWTLIPDQKGNILIYKKFWKDDIHDQEKIVPPLLVYADLIMTDDPRCQETAKIVFEKYLKDEFK